MIGCGEFNLTSVGPQKMASRLSSVAPELEEQLKSSATSMRHRSSLAVAAFAVAQSGLNSPLISATLSAHDSPNISALSRLLQELEQSYYDLQADEEAKPTKDKHALTAFSQARAVNAVLYAVSGQYDEAIYEAIIATDNVAGVSQLLAQQGIQLDGPAFGGSAS